MHDVQHRVTAVGSRDTAKAQQFIDSEINGSKAVKAYGSYAEVYADEVAIRGFYRSRNDVEPYYHFRMLMRCI